MNRRPPNYPPPITPLERRDVSEGVQRDARMRYSLLARSRIPLDGPAGLVSILLLVGVLVVVDLSTALSALRGTLITDESFPIEMIGFHVGALSAIGWMIAIRSTNRRARRRLAGKCVACGYDLAGNKSGTCPECGQSVSS